MAERIAEAYVQIIPTTTGIASAMATEMGVAGTAGGKAMGTGMLSGVKGFIAPIAATIGVVSFGGLIKDSISMASDLVEAGTAVGEIFGDSFNEIQSWARGASTALGQSELSALNAAKTFAVFGKAAGLSNTDLVGFSTGLSGVATDLASFYNTSPEDAIFAIGAALRGEAEPIRKYGILMNDAALKQEALNLGIYNGEGVLTSQQKVLAANSLIYSQAGVALGDFSRTSDGLANQQRIMSAGFDNLKGVIGNAFLPAMTGLVTFVNTSFIPALSWIAENNVIVPALAGIAAAITFVLLPAIGSAIAATVAWTVALLANPITYIVLGIAALVAGIVYLANETTVLQDTWKAMTDGIALAWNFLWTNALKPVFDAIGAAFTVLWDYFINPIITLILIAFTLLAIAADFLWTNAIAPALNAIGAAFGFLWKTFIEPFVKVVINAFEMIGETVQSIFGAIGKFVGDAFKALVGIVKAPVNGLIDLLNNMIDALNSIKLKVPDWVPLIGGQTLQFGIPRIPKLAEGGTLTSGGSVMVGERGAEILSLPKGATVTPLDKAGGKTINYYAAGGSSLDSEQELFQAMRRAKVVAGW
jgi:hypothetical protein